MSLRILRRGGGQTRTRNNFGDYLEFLLFDDDRRQERRVLKAEELDEHYSRTNNGWYNTHLVLAKAHFRADNLPDFNCQTG